MIIGKLTTKAQTVLPSQVRDHLGVGPGDEVMYELVHGGAIIRPLTARRSLDDIDETLPISLFPVQHDLDHPMTDGVVGAETVNLIGDEVRLFLTWAKSPTWRASLEEDMQGIAQTDDGHPLLTTWMPLVTFRETFCGGGRMLQDEATQKMMERLRAASREWRAAGVDTVDISGHVKR